MKLSIGTIFVFAVIMTAVSCQWKYCPGFSGSNINLSKIGINPYPLIKGYSTLMEFVGTAKVDILQDGVVIQLINGSTVVFAASAGPFYIAPQGSSYDYMFVYTFPTYIPPGSYTVRINMMDISSTVLECIQLSANF